MELVEIVWVVLWSGFKFMVGVVFAIAADLGFLVSALSTLIGGMLGVVVYTFFGTAVQRYVARLFPRKKRKKKTIDWKKKLIIRLKKNGGLFAIAFLTPLILSVPLGTFAAVALRYDWHKILIAMLFSFSFWSLAIFGLYYWLGINLREELEKAF